MKIINLILILLIVVSQLNAKSDIDSAFDSYRRGDHETAIKLLRQTIADIGKEKQVNPSLYTGLSDSYSNRDEIDSAFKYNLVTFNLQKSIEENGKPTVTLNSLGMNYLDKGLTHQAIYYFKRSMESNLGNDEEIHIQKGFINLGNAFSNINLTDSSIKYYDLALGLTPEEDKRGKAFLLGTIGTEYFKSGDYTNAEEYLKQSIPYLNSSLNELDSLFYLTNYVALQMHNGDMSQAAVVQQYYKLTKMQNKLYFADANYKMAIYNLAVKKEAEAVKFINAANALFVETGNLQRAKNITAYFLKYSSSQTASQLTYSLDKLGSMQTVLYSDALQTEVKLKMESEEIAEGLRDDLYYSEMSSYLMFLILISFISIVGAVVMRINSQKNIKRLLQDLYEIRAIRKSTMNSNLGKLSTYIAIRDDIKGVEVIGKLLDDVIHDYNKTNIYLNDELLDKKSKRLKV